MKKPRNRKIIKKCFKCNNSKCSDKSVPERLLTIAMTKVVKQLRHTKKNMSTNTCHGPFWPHA